MPAISFLGVCLLNSMKVVGDSDSIPVALSDVEPVTVGAKRSRLLSGGLTPCATID
jgi:hypothetical protein